MNETTNIRNQLITLTEGVCAQAGYEMVDLRFQREQQGWVLRLFIDRIDGISSAEGVNVDDCAAVSRLVGPILDVENIIEDRYHLEVSSPGVARPLRTLGHFREQQGNKAKIFLYSTAERVQGSRKMTGEIVDTSCESDKQCVNVRVGSVVEKIALASIQRAELIPDWDKLMQQGGRRTPQAEKSSSQQQSSSSSSRQESSLQGGVSCLN